MRYCPFTQHPEAMNEPALTEIHGIRQSDWISTSGMHKSSAFRLIKAAHVQPEMRRVPGVSAPVAFLLPEQVELLNALLAEYQSGTSLSQLEQQLAAVGDFQQLSEPVADYRPQAPTVATRSDLSPTVGDHPDQSAVVADSQQPLATLDAGRQLVQEFVGLTAEAFRQALKEWRDEDRTLTSTVDPLEVVRRLKEAADLGVPLSSDELAQVLGCANVKSLNDGDPIRAGFFVRRTKEKVRLDRNQTWWTVIYDSRQESATNGNQRQQQAISEMGWQQSATVVTGMGFARNVVETAAIWGQVDVQLPPAAKGPALPQWI